MGEREGGGAQRGGERQSQAGGQGDEIQRNKPRGRGEREGERRGAKERKKYTEYVCRSEGNK